MTAVPYTPAHTLNPFWRLNRQCARSTARIDGCCRLKEKNLNLILRFRAMLNPARHNDQLALVQCDRSVPEVHGEPTTHHEEEFILSFMMMPDKGTLELDQFHVLPVQGTDDLRIPMRCKRGKLLGQADLLHSHSYLRFLEPVPKDHSR
jgi:hypothetical protein